MLRSAPQCTHSLVLIAVLSLLPRAAAAEELRDGATIEDRIRAGLGPELALLGARAHRPLPADATDFAVTWTRPPHEGSQTVRVTALRPGGATFETWAEVRLAPERRVLVVKRALRAGDVVAEGDLALERTTRPGLRPLETSPATLVGARVLRPLAEGIALDAKDVELPAPAARGSPVRVVIKVGGVLVATNGVLERAARPGEPTSARLKNNARVVRGRLADRETLVVEGEAL